MTISTNLEKLSVSPVLEPFEVLGEMEYDKMLACHDSAIRIVSELIGKPCKVENTIRSPRDFASYLDRCGVGKYFDVKELIVPNHPSKAKEMGYDLFVPPWIVWPQAAGLLFIADKIREHIGSPVKIYNHWRPWEYQKWAAKSGRESDHPNGCAFDLEFKGPEMREKASRFFAGVHKSNPLLECSVGLGYKKMHIGIISPRRARQWTYSSYNGPNITWT